MAILRREGRYPDLGMRSVVNGHLGLPKGPTPVVLLTLGLLGLHICLQATPGARWSLRGLAVSWVGVSLTRLSYCAETFGLAVVGQPVRDRSDASLLAVGEAVPLGPGLILLAADLVLPVVGAATVAAAVWKAEGRLRRSIYRSSSTSSSACPVPRPAAGPHRS